MPSLKKVTIEVDSTQPRSTETSEEKTIATTPLDKWLPPCDGTDKKMRLSPKLNNDEGAVKKRKMNSPSAALAPSRDNTANLYDASAARHCNYAAIDPLRVDAGDSKKLNGTNEDVPQLKSPPELLYNLKQKQPSTNGMNCSQSSGECTGEFHGEGGLLTQPMESVDETERAAYTRGLTCSPSPAVARAASSKPTPSQASHSNNGQRYATATTDSDSPKPNTNESNQSPQNYELDDDFDDEIKRAIELSKQSESKEVQRAIQEEQELQEALMLSAACSPYKPSYNDFDLDFDVEQKQSSSHQTLSYDRYESFGDFYNNLTRQQFHQCFTEWSSRQARGGIEEIERGSLVMEGNNPNDFRKGAAKSDLGNQERAQYGRLSVDALYCILDSLSGTVGKGEKDGLDEEVVGPIGAFMDIGMGIGVQVLQAGLVYGYKSRGIEIMSKRYMLAQELLQAFLEYFRSDPPNASTIQMLQGNFARGFPDGCKGGEPDMTMRNFLLCRDLTFSEQKSLVVFINNAEDVFDARSNDDGKSRSLDSYLGELFGNMQLGVRFVTLTSLAKCFDRKNWFREDILQLRPHCVSWSNKGQPCYVLTKLSDMWTCNDCNLETSVVDSAGRLQEDCVYCTKKPVRTTKRKRAGKSKKYTE